MSQCLNPKCLNQNPPNHKFCEKCGNKLLLGERYRALKIIGQGGFGRTFLAVDEQKPSKPQCVIKQFYPQAQGTDTAEKAAELFAQEAVRLNELGHHDQIPRLEAYLTQEQLQYLVQEYIEGQNLLQELKELGHGFNEAQIWQLLNEVLPILEFIHAGQVIHRDISPDNIIRRYQDKKLVLVDFGASKFATGTALVKTGTIIGKAEYIAPEQGRGKATFASDLYSLGVTCIHLMTQVSPFELFDIGEGAWVWQQFLVDNPVSDNLVSILDRLLQHPVNKRYQSATEVIQAIKQITPPEPQERERLESERLRLEQEELKRQRQEQERLEAEQRKKQEDAKRQSEFKAREERQKREGGQNFIETLPGGIELEMIAIPAGSFLMGSTERSEEKPQHQVKVSAFKIGKYPITQAQYEAVMGTNPSWFKKGGKYPVEQVSRNDAQEFCQKLSKMTQKAYRLLSEAEWEYAARAGTQTRYYFGNDENKLEEYAWYDKNSSSRTHTVGQKKPNQWGLYDMLGNVWEWCEDEWHENYNDAPNNGMIISIYNSLVQRYAMRGGSYDVNPQTCRCAYRCGFVPAWWFGNLGFRVAC